MLNPYFPFKPSSLKFGSNLFANFVVIGLALVMIAISILFVVIRLILINGSGLLAARNTCLKSFYPLFIKLSILTILLQLTSLMLYIYVYNVSWVSYIMCFICILLGTVLTAAITRIKSPNEKTVRKEMYLYNYCLNIIILTLNIYIYYNSFPIEYSPTKIVVILLVILHIVLFVLGRLYNSWKID